MPGTGRDRGARLRAGLAQLAASQAPDGAFQVVVIRGGPGFRSGAQSSPFVTGLVLEALRRLGAEFDTDRLAQRALAYLRAEMEDGGVWRFYRCDPPLRPDLDSTSVALRALRGAGAALDYGAAADRLGAYRNQAGRFRTWAEARPSLRQRFRAGPGGLRPRWFNPVDPVVTRSPGFSPGGRADRATGGAVPAPVGPDARSARRRPLLPPPRVPCLRPQQGHGVSFLPPMQPERLQAPWYCAS